MMGRREVGTGSGAGGGEDAGHSSGGGVVGVGEGSWDRFRWREWDRWFGLLVEQKDDAVDDIAMRMLVMLS